MSIDSIDRYGFCVMCHKNLLTKRVVDGKVVDMFVPFFDDTMFLLDNGSQMQVTICKPCKNSVDLKDSKVHKNIMEAVMKGWELETKMLVADEKFPEWTEDKGKEYLDKMSKLNIDCHSADLDKYVIQQRAVELLNLSVTTVEEEVKDVSN